MKTMLILRGINNLLDEKSAKEYARRRGYRGEVLNVSGETGSGSIQTVKAIHCICARGDIKALYGFSGGGYNVRHIINRLSQHERDQIDLVVVVGAPNNSENLYTEGPWELVYRKDPPSGKHMDGPKELLAELGPEEPVPKPTLTWWQKVLALFRPSY